MQWCKKYELISCLILFLLLTDPNIKAPPETIDYNIYETLGNDSIKINTQNLTWDDAQKRCNAEKANLASLRNDWTQAYVELLAIKLNSPLWIGLNKQQVQGCNYPKLL